jgi:hypothetical protein
VEVFTTPFTAPQRGQDTPSKLRRHSGQIIAFGQWISDVGFQISDSLPCATEGCQIHRNPTSEI